MATDPPNSSSFARGEPVAAATVPPTQIVIQQPSMFGKLAGYVVITLCSILVLFMVLGAVGSLLGLGLSEGPQEKYHSLSKDATKKIAIIDISGTILEGDGFVKKQIDRVREDDDVVAVVLRIDSPGGTVTGADFIYHHLRELAEKREIPMVVSMGSICASGGYYIAMAVNDAPDSIFAEPTTWTGSIGVIIPHFDLSGLLGDWNIKDDSIASGPLKQMGSLTRPMTAEERKLLQELVNQSFDRFKEIVLQGRPKFKGDPQALDAVTTGQIFTADQALQHGLVDKLGFIEEATARAAELSGNTTDKVRCVKYKEQPSFADALMGANARPIRGSLDLAGALDLTAPRAYYMWTWLPTVVSNSPH